jgi:hypothetical protein
MMATVAAAPLSLADRVALSPLMTARPVLEQAT